MDGKGYESIKIVRLVIFVVIAVGTAYHFQEDTLAQFLAILLVFILNSQVRITFLQNRIDRRLFVLSLFADIGVAYYMHTQFPFVAYLLVYVTILDALVFLQEEGYLVTTVVLAYLAFCLHDRAPDVLALNAVLLIMSIVFAVVIRRQRESIMQVELLYDENRKYSYQLEDSKKMLEEYARKVETISQLEERNRISREIHDTLGHKLTGVLMQLDAAIRVVETQPDVGFSLLPTVRDNMSQCIDILRQTVRSMSPKDYANRSISIQQMITDFAKTSGVEIVFETVGNPLKLYPSAEVTLYKNAQECITNAAKHGKATRIKVQLEYCPLQIVLTVQDNGVGCTELVKGMGLAGIEERLQLLGGQLEIHTGNGFTVRTIIPIRM